MTVTIKLNARGRRKLARALRYWILAAALLAVVAVHRGEALAFLGFAAAGLSVIPMWLRNQWPRTVVYRQPRQQVRRPRTRTELGA